MKRVHIRENMVKIPIMFRILKHNVSMDKMVKFKKVKYGEENRQYYRIYNNVKNDKPIIFFIHGGGWWHGSPKTCTPIARYFSKLGYKVVLPAYRLTPKYKYPTQVEDIFTAFKNLVSEESIYDNNMKVIVIGFSAGGELGANLVFNKEMQDKYEIDGNVFKGFISLGGVLDFDKCTSYHARVLIANYIGNDEEMEDVNPINLINGKEEISVLCVHGNKDKLINPENAISFVGKLNRYGGDGVVKLIKNKRHSNITTLVMGYGQKESKLILDFINK